jgi:outer membrane cobalamin receptor
MKQLLTLFSLVLISLLGVAQSSTLVFGNIKTAEGKPVEAATVSLLIAADSKIAKVSVSNNAGRFELENVKPGNYLLQVTAVGFEARKTDSFQVAEGAAEYEANVAPLVATTKQLGEVTVTGRKPLVEQKIDRTVVNVDAMISSAGSNVLELLEKSPGVTVDRDGNVSLRGKSGVIIMIDGKPTYLAGQDLSSYLRNMPANQLDQLEIMTQPPAKYDASGNAGIINIKTKKSKANGFNGSVSAGYSQGFYPKSPNSVNINWRKNKINLFANYGFSYWTGFNNLDINRKFGAADGVPDAIFDQEGRQQFISRNHTLKTGLDFYATKKTTLGINLTGSYNPRNWEGNSWSDILDGNGNLDSTNTARSTDKTQFRNAGINLNMRQVLGPNDHEITADADYVWYGIDATQRSINVMRLPDGTPTSYPFMINGDLPSDIKIYSIKTDYTKPIGKDAKFEAGIKSSLVKTDNNAMYTVYDYLKDEWSEDATRSNHFLYDENINAVYANVRKQYKKWGVQAGLRLENTNGWGEQMANKEKFTRNYTQLFPTLYVNNKLNDKNTLSFNYGRRIERPNYQDMNPFQYFLDQFTYRQGNPYLMPQFSHNVELSHNLMGALNTTLNYTLTNDIINDVLKQDDATKVTFQTKENIGKRRNIGLAVSYNAPVTKWYTLSLYTNVFNNHYEGTVNNTPLDASLTSVLVNVNNQFRFGKGWGAEVSGFYRSKTQDMGIIIAEPMGVINFAGSKQILKGKGSLRLVLNDPFWIQRFRGYTVFGNIDTRINSEWDNRRLGLTFTYRFGKQMQQQPPRRKSGGATEEQQRASAGQGQNG